MQAKDDHTIWWIDRFNNFQPQKRQANRLHFYSFICLALAAASFHYNLAWPARAALAVPFMVTAAQAFKPDNSESLALRLWEEKTMGQFYHFWYDACF